MSTKCKKPPGSRGKNGFITCPGGSRTGKRSGERTRRGRREEREGGEIKEKRDFVHKKCPEKSYIC